MSVIVLVVAGVLAAAALIRLGAYLYDRSVTHKPVLQSLSCRRIGGGVSITGKTYNPNYSSNVVSVGQVIVRLADGSRVEVRKNGTTPPALDPLAAHTTAFWAFTTPTGPLPSPAPIVGCSAVAWNWTPSD